MTEHIPHRRHASFEAAAAAMQQVLAAAGLKTSLKKRAGIGATNLLSAPVLTVAGETTPLPEPIVIYSISDLRAAYMAAEESGCGLAVMTAPGIAGTLGPRWFTGMLNRLQAEYPETPLTAIMDCGDREGVAMAALQHGVPAIYFKGHPTSTQKLQWMARKVKAGFFSELGPQLDLLDNEDAYTACYQWLQQHGTAIPAAPLLVRS